ncbi:abc multidrug protein [Gracilaria domingensis]|nr:abc multidrug protein [Gracilaria domingensis]
MLVGCYVQVVCSQNPGLASQLRHNTPLEQMAADVGINRAERIIHEAYVGLAVHCTRQSHPRALTSGQIHAAAANLGGVAGRKRAQVGKQTAHGYGVFVQLFVVQLSEQDVVAKRVVYNERNLRAVRDVSGRMREELAR